MIIIHHSQSKVQSTIKVFLALILAATLLFGPTQLVFADDGDLDPTFGTGGFVSHNIGDSIDEGMTVAIQSDGKIVAAGYSYMYEGNDSVFLVTRYNSNGSLDSTFDNDGIVTTSFSSIGHDQASDMVIQSDGKILVAGASYGDNNYDFGLVRYNSDGSLDSGFGINGVVVTDYEEEDNEPKAIVVQNDGKIIVVGRTQNSVSEKKFLLVRYTDNGNLDPTFEGDGIVLTSIGSGSEWINDMALQNNGKIIVAGASYNGTDYDFVVARYDTDGTLDTTFGIGGVVTIDFNNEDDQVNDVAIQSNGNILLIGTSGNEGANEMAVVRLNSGGSLDTTFNHTGIVTQPYGYHSYGKSVLILETGQIIAAGFTIIDTDYDLMLVRYNSDGSLDTAFNLSGVVITDLVGDDYCQDITLQSDGKLVLTGSTNNHGDIFVARYMFSDSFTSFIPILLTN